MARKYRYDSVDALQRLGIEYDDAVALRRISMTLHRWHTMECGTDSGCIERENPDEGIGRPYWVYYGGPGKPRRYAIADREGGALKRLGKIMAKYAPLQPFIQTDPRGAALYILRPGDVPEGKHADAYYSRGIVVCQ